MIRASWQKTTLPHPKKKTKAARDDQRWDNMQGFGRLVGCLVRRGTKCLQATEDLHEGMRWTWIMSGLKMSSVWICTNRNEGPECDKCPQVRDP